MTLSSISRRRAIQWGLLPIALITIALGWKYPVLGFFVPLVMAAGVAVSFSNGRWVCGNICPRGAFFDRVLSKLSLMRYIPAFLRRRVFRWLVLAALMGLMAFQILQNPGDPRHWGIVFWRICVITTAVGVIGGIFIHSRFWCAFCPMGTMQSEIGGSKRRLLLDREKCIECGLCEKACPFDIKIVSHKDEGRISDRDCLKCLECMAVCPTEAITRPQSAPAKDESDKEMVSPQ